MKNSFRTGLGFGLTSGVITTLGLAVGLNASSGSKTAVLTGILMIAVSDSLSDALGIHIAQESKKNISETSVWESTFSTLLSKFLIAMSFAVPVIILPLNFAVAVCIGWGIILLSVVSVLVARNHNTNPIRTISEHLGISFLVIIMTYFLGRFISGLFK